MAPPTATACTTRAAPGEGATVVGVAPGTTTTRVRTSRPSEEGPREEEATEAPRALRLKGTATRSTRKARESRRGPIGPVITALASSSAEATSPATGLSVGPSRRPDGPGRAPTALLPLITRAGPSATRAKGGAVAGRTSLGTGLGTQGAIESPAVSALGAASSAKGPCQAVPTAPTAGAYLHARIKRGIKIKSAVGLAPTGGWSYGQSEARAGAPGWRLCCFPCVECGPLYQGK